jgi:primosomal protein N'
VRLTVSLSLGIVRDFTYEFRGDLQSIRPGCRVLVPLGMKAFFGWVTSLNSAYNGRVKPVLALVKDGFSIPDDFLEFSKLVAADHFISTAAVLDAALPPKQKSVKNGWVFYNQQWQKWSSRSFSEQLKHAAQQTAEFYLSKPQNIPEINIAGIRQMRNFCESTVPSPAHRFVLSMFNTQLLQEEIAKNHSQQKSTLIIVPDNLTATALKQVIVDADIYNSDCKTSEREKLWHGYMNGKQGVVIGSSSAVLLPAENFGSIIIERSSSSLYRSNPYSGFNAAKIARIRSQFFSKPLIERSAAYTVDYKFKESGVLVCKQPLPEIPIQVFPIHAREKKIPAAFLELVKQLYMQKKKCLLLVNKKEGQPFLFCPACQRIIGCPACRGNLALLSDQTYQCRSCGKPFDANLVCPTCKTSLMVLEDISLNSLLTALAPVIPSDQIITLFSIKGEELPLISEKINQYPLVIAAPLIINPYFRKRFDAVLYLKPETLFNMDQYYAAETIFTFVSELKELLVKPDENAIPMLAVFSVYHFHYALKHINQENEFFEREMKYRQWMQLPPYANVYRLEFKHRSLRTLGQTMREFYQSSQTDNSIKQIGLCSPKKKGTMYRGFIEWHNTCAALFSAGLHERQDIDITPVCT